jgi:hypothetical protein
MRADPPSRDDLPSGDELRAALDRLERFAYLADESIRIPGTGKRIGLDGLVGLIPGLGDAAGLVVGAVVPLVAWRLGAPPKLVGRMLLALGADALVGVVPVLGDVADMAYKVNRRNVERLKAHLDAEGRLPPPADAPASARSGDAPSGDAPSGDAPSGAGERATPRPRGSGAASGGGASA